MLRLACAHNLTCYVDLHVTCPHKLTFLCCTTKAPQESEDPGKKRQKRSFSRKRTQRVAVEENKDEPDEEALLLAAEDNDVDSIIDLLDRGTPVDCVTDDGYTPLQLACNFGAAEAAEVLLDRGADINHTANDKTTPLLLSAYAGHGEVLDVLLNDKHGQSLNLEAELENGATALYMAAQEGFADCIHKLIVGGANPDHAAADGVIPLYVAAHEGHIPALVELAKYSDVNHTNNRGITPLYIAVQIESEEAVKVLLEHKANPVVQSSDGSTSVEAAIFHGNRKICDQLFDAGVPVNYVRASDGNTAVGLAAHVGNFELAVDLYKRGADLKKKNKAGQTVRDIIESQHGMTMAEAGLPDEEALFIAAEDNDVDTINYLIKLGTSVNCIGQDDYTPLMMATCFGSGEACKNLLDHGAGETIDRVATDGSTALILAAYGGHAECCKHLLANDPGPDEMAILPNGATALYMATQENHVECVKILSESGVAVNVPKQSKVTPLYIAAHEGVDEMVEILLHAKADPDISNDHGATPAYIAVQKCHPHTVEVLLEHKANPNLSTNEGSSPLAIAVFHCNPRLVRRLLEKGATVDKPLEDGNTEAMMAAYSGDVDILQTLLEFGASCNLTNKNKYHVDDILRSIHGTTLPQVVEEKFHDKNHIHDEEHDEYLVKAREVFDALDDDKSGAICIKELTKFFEDSGMKELYRENFESFVETEFHRLNHDGDDNISFDEFKTCFTRIERLKHRTTLGESALVNNKNSEDEDEFAAPVSA